MLRMSVKNVLEQLHSTVNSIRGQTGYLSLVCPILRAVIRHYTEIRLKSHMQETLPSCLSTLLNDDQLEPWQVSQAVDALKFIFLSIHSPLSDQVDWEYWKMSSKELEHDHATVARNNSPIKKLVSSILPHAS